ncbi:GTP-binding protein Era [Candidatus Nitrosoglobus terrae]|uniref:GTPase Era n=1 Tax=Candidatus Nitrosoglobus terrae TaxID=1630141 RepID=A0A1Q2SNZ4_9GAMM|nr:GTPase Era [Candidatus Nitrosoglobus terrae]BAW80850.1 GTP-binding protein Era [Candidatus Nitrosoglobus terrae]
MTEGLIKEDNNIRCGYAALIGRPNVGKSTLLNHILGQKVSITAHRPQTTRHRILGIKTLPRAQVLYVDTPGFQDKERRLINRYLNQSADSTIEEVDLILFIVEANRFTKDDEWILRRLAKCTIPIVLVLNKIDRLTDKKLLLPMIEQISRKMEFTAIVPISAWKGDNISALERKVVELLPEGPMIYPEDQVTDRNERFLAAEFIREKLIRHLGQELPYVLTVMVESFEEEQNLYRIAAVIYVERLGQKAIVIGKEGERLKQVGYEARIAMEKMFERKVYLKLWVKVREGWPDNEHLLHSFGYKNN